MGLDMSQSSPLNVEAWVRCLQRGVCSHRGCSAGSRAGVCPSLAVPWHPGDCPAACSVPGGGWSKRCQSPRELSSLLVQPGQQRCPHRGCCQWLNVPPVFWLVSWWCCRARTRSPLPAVSAISCSVFPGRVMLPSGGSGAGGRGVPWGASRAQCLLPPLDGVRETDLRPVFGTAVFLTNGFKGLSVSALLPLFIALVFVWQKVFCVLIPALHSNARKFRTCEWFQRPSDSSASSRIYVFAGAQLQCHKLFIRCCYIMGICRLLSPILFSCLCANPSLILWKEVILYFHWLLLQEKASPISH